MHITTYLLEAVDSAVLISLCDELCIVQFTVCIFTRVLGQILLWGPVDKQKNS